MILRIKGSASSGWYAPPRGTHGGSAVYIEQPDANHITRWAGQIQSWQGRRRGLASSAIGAIRQGSSAVVIEENGQLKAIASVNPPHEVAGLFGPRIVGDVLDISFCATAERGYGHKMMQGIARTAIQGDWTLTFMSLTSSLGFYKAIGFEPAYEGGKLFVLDVATLKTWLESSPTVLKAEPNMVAFADAEPDDGIFVEEPVWKPKTAVTLKIKSHAQE